MDRTKRLTRIATDFRKAFEETDLSSAPGSLHAFPEGCCSWATWIVGHFLKFEQGYPSEEVQAKRKSFDGTDSHAWVSVEGLVIDITADMFEDALEPVIVKTESEWHNSWTIDQIQRIERIERLDKVGFRTALRPSDVYNLLSKQVRPKYANT